MSSKELDMYRVLIKKCPGERLDLEPNWTGGCTRHGVRVAIEVKHLMGALGGPHNYLGAPKDPPGGLKLLKMNIKENNRKTEQN